MIETDLTDEIDVEAMVKATEEGTDSVPFQRVSQSPALASYQIPAHRYLSVVSFS